MKGLPEGYRVEAGPLSEEQWGRAIDRFHDATLYQTYAYGSVRWGKERLVHLLLIKSDRVVGAAQVIARKLPGSGLGIAYLPWGPLWQPKDGEPSIEHFRLMARALRAEFALRQGLLLRIRPQELAEEGTPFDLILREEGYEWNAREKKHRTILLNLESPLEDIRKNFQQKWRNQLNRAEKNNLEVEEGTEEGLYRIFLDLAREMLDRKGFEPGVDYREFQAIQAALPERHKMKIFVCRMLGQPVACTIGTAIGDTGIYLLGATSDSGMQSKGSYLLQWRMIQWLKERGCRWYDLGGISPEGNPGVYHFKEGCAGKTGRDVHHLGQYEACHRPLNRILVHGYETARRAIHRIRKGKG